jgi:hypothetical protein
MVVDGLAKITRTRIGPFSAGVNALLSFCLSGVVSPVVVQVTLLLV